MRFTVIPALVVLLGLALSVGACAAATEPPETDGNVYTLYVGPELVDCVGVAPQKCMQIKKHPEDEYTLLYDQIEGFDYEEGYEYELVVEETEVDNPPADASSIKLTLVEVTSKTPVDD